MKKFTIWVNQFDMGSFEGTDEANALDQYAAMRVIGTGQKLKTKTTR